MPAGAAIFLFTDFGSADIYVGQVKSVLHEHAPRSTVIDLAHDVACFDAKAAAHLLAALAPRLPPGAVVVAVVDPGVGSARRAIAIEAGERWYVGPDNGLLSVVAARAQTVRVFSLDAMAQPCAVSFHGRDLFAPAAARIACGDLGAFAPHAACALAVDFGADDLAGVIHIDHYGNALTGLRASNVHRSARIRAGRGVLGYARVFSDVAAGEAFWYENSIGLVEIAANQASAASVLGLRVGEAIDID